MLLLGMVVVAGCGDGADKKTTVFLRIERGNAVGQIERIELATVYAGISYNVPLSRKSGEAELLLPQQTMVTVPGSGGGRITIVGTAFAIGGAQAGRGSTEGTVVEGETLTLTLEFGKDLGEEPDAGMPDAEVDAAGEQPLTVSAPGGTAQCSVGGAAAGACAASYPFGTVVTISAAPTAAHYHVSGWSADCATATGATCTVTMSAPRMTTVSFAIDTVRLTFLFSGTGSGGSVSDGMGFTCTQSGCYHDYPYGAVLDFGRGMGNAESSFSSWSGCPNVDDGGNCTLTLTDPLTITAQFDSYYFNVAISPAGGGRVVSADGTINCPGVCSGRYPYGHGLTLTATPSTGYGFFQWVGGVCGAPAYHFNNPCSIGTYSLTESTTVQFALP